jgi:hypothetical protein
MAPFNVPIGNDLPQLVNDLSDRFRNEAPGQVAVDGVRSYFESIRQATFHLRDRGVGAWYPTHFLHAWSAARGRGVELDAYLFENDGEGAGRRALLSEFVSIANFLLAQEGLNAVVASYPGDFRNAVAWPSPALRPGCALVLMMDPLQMQEERADSSYIDPRDIRPLAHELRHRYLQPPI